MFFSTSQGQQHQLLIQSHPEPVRDTSHTSELKFPFPYEIIISCLTNKFQDRFLEVTSIYEPQHGEESVYGHVLASLILTATHASFRDTSR